MTIISSAKFTARYLTFNTSFHKINRDGRLRAHVARLCAVARRKLVLTEVRSKLQVNNAS